MRSSKKNVLLRRLAVIAVAAPFLAGCNESSPTEPKVVAAATPAPTPTPRPPGGNVTGTWTGTFNSTDFLDCDTEIVSLAQATLSQNGSDVGGTLTATGDPNGCPCGNLTFAGTLQENALKGTINLPAHGGSVHGALTGQTLNVSLRNTYGTTFGQMQLHR